MGAERETEDDDEFDGGVSLELSIGGCYGKFAKGGKYREDPVRDHVSRSDFFACNNNRDLEKKRKREEDEVPTISLHENGHYKGASAGETYSSSPDARAPRSNIIKRLKAGNSNSQIQASKPGTHCNAPNLTKPPKPQNHKTQGGPDPQQMPCVTTTGNGPHGKTVTGFLCKYTKNEVSIVCVCHGRFFSPAEFVEHAGGVDVVNPLRHITIVNSVKR